MKRHELKHILNRLWFIVPLVWTTGCILNHPYPVSDRTEPIHDITFSGEPKHLDPAISYSLSEYNFVQQIYEPPLQYHYLKRPYQIIPLTVESVPEPRYFDFEGNPLPNDVHPEQVAKTVYELRVRPGIQYQPHPCFAKDAGGNFRYHALTNDDVKGIYEMSDFAEMEEYAKALREALESERKRREKANIIKHYTVCPYFFRIPVPSVSTTR